MFRDNGGDTAWEEMHDEEQAEQEQAPLSPRRSTGGAGALLLHPRRSELPPKRSTGRAGALLSPPRRSERVTSRHNCKRVNNSGFTYAIEEDIPPEPDPDPFSESELDKFAYSCIQADRASTTLTDLFDATIHSLYSDDTIFGTVSYNAA